MNILKVMTAVVLPATLKPAAPRMKRKRQWAALPWRRRDGGVEVLLVTSRDTRRWIIPKGWPKKRMMPHKLALLEAYEEAGVRGKIDRDEIGYYTYVKRFADKKDALCRVGVFPLKVKVELDNWPEMEQRERRWMSREAAAELVREAELAALLRGFTPQD